MRAKHIILTLLLILGCAAGALAYQGGCPGQRHYQDFMSGLTPEQQQKIQKVTDAHHETLFALHKEIAAKYEALEKLFSSVPVDKKAVEAAVNQMTVLQAKKLKLSTDYRIELSEIAGKPIPLDRGQGYRGPDCGDRGPGCGAKTHGPCQGRGPQNPNAKAL